MKKPENKLYVARKYIEAQSLDEAIKKERTTPLDEIWVDDDWKKAQGGKTEAIGFHIETQSEEYINEP